LLAIIALIKFHAFSLSLSGYQHHTRYLLWLLKPAVVALGWAIWKERQRLREFAWPLLGGVVLATNLSLVLSIAMARWLGASVALQKALAVKAVTSAILVDLSARLHVEPALAVPLVIFTGIVGAIIGVPILHLVGVRHPLAIGLAMGSTSSGLGTARAAQEGELAAAIAGLSMGLMGFGTAFFAPWIFRLFQL
jgi:putative effector of murein hydrolase